jgi:hypothetical protein
VGQQKVNKAASPEQPTRPELIWLNHTVLPACPRHDKGLASILIPRSQVRSLPAHLGKRSKRKRAQHPGSCAECRGCDEAGDPVAEHGRGEVPVHQPHDFNADEFQ